MAKGKWAQGIKPRAFQWIIQDQLAVCERPGGYGTNHRRVRRQEEVIWIREQNFSYIVSLIPSDHNLHSYDEQGMPWRHWPFAPTLDLEIALPQIYGELQALLASGKRLLLHTEEVGDRLAGLMGGYLRWTGMVPVTFEAITVIERVMTRQLGPEGRAIITAAETSLTTTKRPAPKVESAGNSGQVDAAEPDGAEATIEARDVDNAQADIDVRSEPVADSSNVSTTGFIDGSGGSMMPEQTCGA